MWERGGIPLDAPAADEWRVFPFPSSSVAEQVTVNHSVAGSNPALGVIHKWGSTKDLYLETAPPYSLFLWSMIERPYLGPDMSYSEQRKCRMQDAIDDYLNDEEVDARRSYEEMLSCIDDVRKYHKKQYDKADELYNLLLGNRNPFPSEWGVGILSWLLPFARSWT